MKISVDTKTLINILTMKMN